MVTSGQLNSESVQLCMFLYNLKESYTGGYTVCETSLWPQGIECHNNTFIL